MLTSRLEAFSDAVIAIIITIMVLELHVPEGHTLADLWHSTGLHFLTYVLSFVYLGIYWNNHHHLFQVTQRVTGSILWANLGLLFCLSLYPFTTGWVAESKLAATPMTVYGVNLLAAAVAFYLLQVSILRSEGPAGPLHRAIGSDTKGKVSPVLYSLGIAAAAISDHDWATGLAIALFVGVAILWLVPDRRIERTLTDS